MPKPSPRRMSGYVRVSRVAGREGESFISPDVQRDHIAGWAKLRGVDIVGWHEDLDVSGNARAADRPGLAAFMEQLRAGETEGIVVARLDRLSRLGVADALGLVEDIQQQGGSIAALDLGIDPTTPFGEFAMTLMLGLARMERRRIADSWDSAKSRAVQRGVKIGPTPFGYRRVEGGQVEPDPVNAPIVAKAFKLAAQDGLDAAHAYLAEHGNGRTWTVSTVRRLLAKRSYLGESRYGALVNASAHEPVVPRALWEAAQPARAGARRAKASFPLSGLASCAQCGHALVGARGGNDGRRMYRCSAALATFKGERCTRPTTVTARLLEDLTRSALLEALEAHPGGYESVEDVDVAAAQDALLEAERVLAEYATDADLQQLLGLAAWRAGAEERARRVDAARGEFRDVAQRAERQPLVLAPDVLRDAELEDLGGLLRGALADVVVERGRTPLAGRVRLVAK